MKKETKSEKQLNNLNRSLEVSGLTNHEIVNDMNNGKLYGLKRKGEGYHIDVGYMSYERMDSYLRGYYDHQINKLNY